MLYLIISDLADKSFDDLITSHIRCKERGMRVEFAKKKEKRNTHQSDTTIISIAGERGAVRER